MFSSNNIKMTTALCFVAVSALAQQQVKVNTSSIPATKAFNKVEMKNKLHHISNANTLVTANKNLGTMQNLDSKKIKLLKEKKSSTLTDINTIIGQQTSAKANSRADEKTPYAYYVESAGTYHLVPGYYIDNANTIAADPGYLAPMGTSYSFSYKSFENVGGAPTYYQWLVGQTLGEEPSISLYSYPMGNIIESPILAVGNSAGEDEYQAGTMTWNRENGQEIVPGTILEYPAAWIYNVDVDAYPMYHTGIQYVDEKNPWSDMWFSGDYINKPIYIEFYEAPASGHAAILGNTFIIFTPASVDLSQKQFKIHYYKQIDESDNSISMPEVKTWTSTSANITLYDESTDLRAWRVLASLDEFIMMDSKFIIGIEGPNDGTKWALLSQTDRLDRPTYDVTTCAIMPTAGSQVGSLLYYQYQDAQGQTYLYPTSLDLHTFLVNPYIYILNDEQYFLADTLNLGTGAAQYAGYVYSWDAVKDMQISKSADWFDVSLSEHSENGQISETICNMIITTNGLPAETGGRIGNVTFTDSYGVSKTFYIVQGDLALNIDATISGRGLSAACTDNVFNLTYPASYNKVNVLTTSGQIIGSYELPESGETTISAAGLEKGIYLMQFVGADTKTVKVVK